MVKAGGKQPIHPLKMVGWFVDPVSGTRSIGGLRDATTCQSYQWFCENFMECVIPSSEWKLKSRKQKLSNYITPTLEAFGILVYFNSFDVWNQRWKSSDNSSSSTEIEDDLSTLSGGTEKCSFKFTGDAKGSKKYEGWNGNGMHFYNNLLGLVESQRARTGCTFENDVLYALASKPRNRGGSHEGTAPEKARNHMNVLMDLVGVQ
jgi:hypothetical protein